MSSGTRHTHIGTGWLERKGEEDGGRVRKWTKEGGRCVQETEDRPANQFHWIVFFSQPVVAEWFYTCVCVCLAVLVCVTIHQHCVDRRRCRLRRRRRWLCVLLFEICSRIVVVVGLVYFMCVCVCVCVYINWQCGWVVVVAELNLDFVLLALRFAIFVRVSFVI